MRIVSVLFILGVFVFFACNNKLKIDSNAFNLEEPFQLRVTETAKMTNGNLQLSLTGIPEDSRCPEDVNCIWEGQIRLFIDAAIPEKKESIEYKIEKSKMGKVDHTFQNYNILVQDVQPLTQSGVRISKENYIVTLKVSPK